MPSSQPIPPPEGPDRFQQITDQTGRVVTHFKTWSEEQLPGYTRRMQALTLHAYRSGWKVLGKNELTSSGIDLYSGAAALAITVALYLACNLYLTSWVENAYDRFEPPFLQTVSTQEDARHAFVAAGWLDETAADKSLGVSNSTFAKPFHAWIEDIFFQFGVDLQGREFKNRMRSLVTGNRTGWLIITLQSTTGNQIYEDLLRREGPTGHMATTIGSNSTKKRLFIAMTDELLVSVQQPIRWIYCINGWIQFLTVLLSIFVLIAIGRRYLFVLRLAYQWLRPIPTEPLAFEGAGHNADRQLADLIRRARAASETAKDELASVELERIRSEADRAVYDSYWFIAGILPSLGFIGTVVGMSAALLKADRLFVAADRQLAIADMTKELGLAFDTTLIALLMGLIVSVPLSTVRARELTFYREFARKLGALGTSEEERDESSTEQIIVAEASS